MAVAEEFKDVINIDSTASDSSSEEIEVVEELKTISLENHRCDLCCQGEFLIEKLHRFGGLINGEFKFVCDKCDKSFVSNSELKKHSLQCKGLVFDKDTVISYVKKQQSNGPITCSVCSKTLKSKAGYTLHLKSQHSGLIHSCEICKKKFSKFGEFRRHCYEHQLKRHSYACTVCKKKFRYNDSLKRHMLTHNAS